jgi:regulator of PEP synthase PpsR (kinase-PPPase family)
MPRRPRFRPGPILIVSGGYGASGEQLARTALAQFIAGVAVEVRVIPHVLTQQQVFEAVETARRERGTILHTLVDPKLRRAMIDRARERNVVAIDLIGRLLGHLTSELGQRPLGRPGMYRQLREDYFQRVEAIEFTLLHDDGKKIDELGEAELILVGPSRVGKTPLSIYLSTLGWKVANVPIVHELPVPSELLQADHGRIVGLTIDPMQLLSHRQRRQEGLRVGRRSPYTNPELIVEEVETARRLYRREGFPIINMTNRQIEEAADEVINLTSASRAEETP